MREKKKKKKGTRFDTVFGTGMKPDTRCVELGCSGACVGSPLDGSRFAGGAESPTLLELPVCPVDAGDGAEVPVGDLLAEQLSCRPDCSRAGPE